MNEMSIGEIIKDFRSIKLDKKKRAFIDQCRQYFESHGNLPLKMKVELRRMMKNYSTQFGELHAARERARKTLWRKKNGLTIEQAHQLVSNRRTKVSAEKADVGL